MRNTVLQIIKTLTVGNTCVHVLQVLIVIIVISDSKRQGDVCTEVCVNHYEPPQYGQ